MTTETHKNSYECKPTVQELLDDKSGRYTNLQIILNRKDNRSLGLGQEYLVVNNIGFGVYQLNDIDYSDGIILMTLTNISNGNIAEITMDINDEHPQYYLICWDNCWNWKPISHE
ncbi:MAG: hypothetical protein ABR974_12560 [Bacteroidales bacterium]